MKQTHPRVLFLHSPAPGAEGTPPLGAGCVAAALAASGAASLDDIRLLEVPADDTENALLSAMRTFEPDVVGFSCYVWNSASLVRLAGRLREASPTTLLVAGGPDAEGISLDPLRSAPFDALFLGEAELSFPSWLSRRLAEGRHERSTEPSSEESRSLRGRMPEVLRGPYPGPEAMPSPWLSGPLEPRRGASVAWELVRGCPFNCAYCYEGRGVSGLRQLPLGRIERELELFLEAGVEEVFVLDPTFNAGRGRVLEFLDLLARKGGGIHWNFEVRAELLDMTQAKAFSRLSCAVQIGLQSAKPEVLASVGRTLDRKRFAAAARLLDGEGVVYGFDLIYGLPGDDLGGFRESLDFALSLSPNHLDLFPLAVLPGTGLFGRAAELGLEFSMEPPYLLEASPSFPKEDMEKAKALADATSLFYSRGRAVPWFEAILKPLRTRPSIFLGGLVVGKGDLRLPHREAERIQCAHVEESYREKGQARLLPEALDLIRYHGAWSRAFAEGERSVVELVHPLELMESAEMLNLKAAATYRLTRALRVEIVPGRRGPRVRML